MRDIDGLVARPQNRVDRFAKDWLKSLLFGKYRSGK